MARSLGSLTVDLLLKAGAFESDAGRAARIADKEAKSIARSFDAAGKAIGVALATGVAVATAAIGNAINRMDDMSKAAQRANMPTEEFSKLAHAASLADVSMEDLQGAMGKLAKSQAAALSSTSAQAKMFDQLGISVKNADGSLRKTSDVFVDFADKFQQFKGSPEIMAAGMQLFGKSFQTLIPMLKDGSEGLRAAFTEAEKLGLVLSTTAGAQAEQFNDNLSKMRAMIGGVAVAFASDLLPTLVKFTDGVVDAIKAAGGAEAIMRKVSGVLSTIGTVAKAAGVYISSVYAASLVMAAGRMVALIATTGTLSAATLGLTGVMTRLRVAAAFLFGPVGLIAAGATALYLLATAETDAEKAANQHKLAMDAVNAASKIGKQYAYEVAAAKREEAAAALTAAKGYLAQANAMAAVSAQQAAGSGPGSGFGNSAMALQGAANFNSARADEAAANVKQLTANVVQLEAAMKNVVAVSTVTRGKGRWANVRNGDDVLSGWMPDPAKLDLSTDTVTKATKAIKDNGDAAAKAAQQAEQAAQQRADALRTMEDWTAQLAGPAAEALLRYSRLEDDANEKRGQGALSLKEYGDALAMIQTMRERDPDLMSAQAKAAAAYVADQKAYAEAVSDAWVGAANDGARAFGDWFANGFKGAKDFASGLKNIFKRLVSDLVGMFLQNSLVKPFQNMLQQASGFNSAGGQQQSGVGQVMGNMFSTAMDKMTGFFGNLFGRGGPAQTAVSAGTGTAMDGWFGQLKTSGGLFGMAGRGGAGGGVMMANGQQAGASFGMSPWMGAIGGAAMGYSMGGDTAGKIAGGVAGGIVGVGAIAAGSAFAATGSVGAAATAFGSAGGMLGVGAIPVIGWIALAAFAVNAISGGKLFGTKYKTDSAAQQFSVGESGASGFTSVSESGQKSFFRGKKYRTTTTALDAEGQKAIQELFDMLASTVTQASKALGVDVPDLVGGTFRREFDSKGNLTREFGTIAGRVYNEAQDAFAQRLVGENLLSVAKQAGSAAELEGLANAYRATGEELKDFATLALAVQADIKNANGLWKQSGEGVMTKVVELVERMAGAGEALAEAYARIQQALLGYGDLIGGVRVQIATHGLNQYQKAQLDVELQYRAQVKQANELAKALGLSGARSEDLASIEQLRAINMASLAEQYKTQQQNQNQQWLQDMGLSDLSPLRDDQKLTKAMGLLQSAVDGGDAAAARKLAEQVLGFGRKLYASGEDYNALYAQVTGLVGDMSVATMEDLQGLTNEQLATLADLVSGLPAQIAQELAALLLATPPVTETPVPVPTPLPPAPTPQPPPSGGGGGGYGDGDGMCVAFDQFMDDGLRAVDAQVGHMHDCMDPQEGASMKPLLVAGRPVIQDCVRIVTESGAALVCSRSTPFTDVDAPADAPEWTHYAPAMRGKRVYVVRAGVVESELVTAVHSAGQRYVVPLDFGGRSFPAGEVKGALIYSHNMQKGPNLNPMGGESPRVLELLADIADTNKRMEQQGTSSQLDALNGSSRSTMAAY
ncbi:hypothetical protein [Thermomonas sp.]